MCFGESIWSVIEYLIYHPVVDGSDGRVAGDERDSAGEWDDAKDGSHEVASIRT